MRLCVQKGEQTRRQFYEKHLPEQTKQAHNLSMLLKFSNVTPFKDRNALGYVCAYCVKTFADPADLRTHTKKDHEKHRLAYKAGKDLNKFVACLDIVDLKCELCLKPIEDLNELEDHLIDVHNKKYYKDTAHYIQPFKLTTDHRMQCCLCSGTFDSMKNLFQHMNVHFRNFICLACGAGFVNKHRLIRHESTHEKKKTEYPCKFCEEIFEFEWKRKSHINTVHKGLAGDSICQICKTRFKNYYQKSRHMIEAHNAAALNCDLCDRKFTIKSTLLQHVRRDHMKERAYECEVCKMSFFVRKRMQEHMVVHTGKKDFSCDVCGKAFARRKNLKCHLKTHEHGCDGS